MNLYLIHQSKNNGYDTYDAAVVAAENEDSARHIHPAGDGYWNSDGFTWVRPEDVTVELIGTAVEGQVAGVVMSSFNAG